MASEGGGANTPLIKVLLDEPYRFDFFQAVRLLERIYPERVPLARGPVPLREVVRFRTRATLNFPPSQLYEITRNGDADPDAPLEMMVAFMGMTGPLGVLPHQYTEMLMERVRYKDTALWSFLDLFSHRMISLFYRAWEKHHFPIAYERGDEDRFTEFLFDIIGMGTRGLRPRRLNLEDQGLLFYSGLIAQRPHSASALKAMLGDYFGISCRIEQFRGQWLKLDEDSISYLGQANSELGMNTIAGTRVWNNQSKFRVTFGPLSYQEFKAFIPVGTAYKPATSLIRFMAGMEFDFDVQLVLKAKEVPSCILTTRAKRRPMLGWSTWLKTSAFTEDDDQVVLPVNN
jgi:type VI secretion system protein ImpH